MAVARAERRAQPLAVLRIEPVEQPPRAGKHRRRVAELDPVEAARLEQLPHLPRCHRRKPGRHERVGDHRQPSGIVDRVDRVLDGHVHANPAVQEEPDDVDSRRKGCRDLLTADQVDAERGPNLDRRSKLGDRVVIGDAEDVEPDRGGRTHQILGADHPVAREGVRVDFGDTEALGGAHASTPLPLHRLSVDGRSGGAFAALRTR